MENSTPGFWSPAWRSDASATWAGVDCRSPAMQTAAKTATVAWLSRGLRRIPERYVISAPSSRPSLREQERRWQLNGAYYTIATPRSTGTPMPRDAALFASVRLPPSSSGTELAALPDAVRCLEV